MLRRRYSRRQPNLTRDNAGAPTVQGYAAVYFRDDDKGTEFDLLPGVVERIRPGAFARAIEERQDVVALFNHDDNQILARFPGTLELEDDESGLRYRFEPSDESPIARHVVEAVERGDVRGSSFAFEIVRDSREAGADEAPDVRWIEDVNLFDVSLVVHPAYEGTSAALRGAELELERREHNQWKRIVPAWEIPARLRLLEIDEH